MKTDKSLPTWLRGLLIGGTFVALWYLERRRPLRRKIESTVRHEVRNLAIAAVANGVVEKLEMPVVSPLTRLVERRGWGVLKRYQLPPLIETALAVALLDYTLYWWHMLTHKLPLLWRFHQPHHVDLDMTASTALRFHAGELALSVLWRAGQVVIIGVSPRALSIWQTLTLLEIMFHHADVALDPELERKLSRVIVTPRLHGIHHSTREAETHSNWSSGLTVWDWLHGTLRRDVPQESITIGLPAWQEPNAVTLPKVMAMPFEEARG